MADQPSEPQVPSDPPKPGETPRNFSVDFSEGLDDALKKLRERAAYYYKKGQHTRVRIKFRGKELTTMPLAVLVAAEAASFWWIGIIEVLAANFLGKTLLDVEMINDADGAVADGKQKLLDGELDEALTHFREALVMDRDHPAAHLNIGIALKLKGQREEAIASFEKAAGLDATGETGKEARRQLEKMKTKAG